MTDTTDAQAPPGPLPLITPARVVVALCLLAPFVGTLWVSSYAKTGPELSGVPFFYWYQLLWVPISAVLTVTAYLLLRREDRQRRAATSAAGGDGQ